MLEVRNLSKRFKKNKALENVSLSFEPGIYGLLGPNGAGKTTLLRCLTLLYPEAHKSIYFKGKPISAVKDYLAHIGYLPQQFGLFRELRVLEMMELLANLKGIPKRIAAPQIEKALELVNLTDQMQRKVGALSGGMIRRLGIAQAITGEPSIILFDEPTTGLDPEERLRFKDLLREIQKDKLIVISTHIVDDVEAVCTHIAVMEKHTVAACDTAEGLQGRAHGKVYVLDDAALEPLQQEFHLVKYAEENGQRKSRILTNETLPYDAVKPTVEDGYLCVVKNI